MGWFLRNIDEPEDESRLPRRVVLGVLGVGVAAVLGMILIAVGLASFMAARHRGASTASRSISPPQPSPPPIASKSSSPTHAAKTVAWRVRADPKRIAPLPSIEPPGLLTLAPAEKLVFPSTPSVFAVSDPESPALPHRVWNLATAEPVGAIRVRQILEPPYALSADGTFLAGKVPSATTPAISIFSINDKHHVRTFALEGDSGNLELLAFVDDRYVLAVDLQASKRRTHVWRISDGELCGRFLLSGPGGAGTIAVSPGGQYLAVAAGKKLDVHRLPDGEIMGEISLSSKDDFASLICRGIAFAPDMSELAAYCESGDASQIACWSLASGEKTVEHTLSRASLVESAAAVAPSASVLDWLPDREGWLVFGCLAIDRKLGKHLVTISRSGPDMVFIGTRVLGRDHLAVIEDKNGARHIRVIPIPREKLAQAREAARVQ